VAFFDQQVAQASTKTSSGSELTIQMQQYLRINNIERKVSWWKHNSASHLHISRVAKKYLSIPVSSERIFSKAGQVISQKRNQNMLTCLSF